MSKKQEQSEQRLRRSVDLHTRVTIEEREEIVRRCQEAGFGTVSAYARHLLLGPQARAGLKRKVKVGETSPATFGRLFDKVNGLERRVRAIVDSYEESLSRSGALARSLTDPKSQREYIRLLLLQQRKMRELNEVLSDLGKAASRALALQERREAKKERQDQEQGSLL